MSQRCLISKKENIKEEDEFFDCIYTEEGNVKILLEDWCGFDYKTGMYFGPWKLTIRDKEIFDSFLKDFEELGKRIPDLQSLDDIWVTYVDGIPVRKNPEITKDIDSIIDVVINQINDEES